MILDITKFEELVEQGYIRKAETNQLVIYKYTDSCTYEKKWNEYTRQARGLILEKSTGKVIGLPLKKFFNVNEMPEAYIGNLPVAGGYEVFEKLDGSLGIIFNYQGVWNVATVGSFTSDQALKAKEMLSKYDLSGVSPNITLLAEIIYPDNKIVVNYENQEKLVLLGAFNRETGKEIPPDFALEHYSERTGMEAAKVYSHTIEQMIELQKTLSKDQEGFVVRFQNGLRIKIKGDEYMRIHKIISCLSPLSLWEVMVNGIVNKEYLTHVPEEYRAEYEHMVESLESQYIQVSYEIKEDLTKLPCLDVTPEGKKAVGLYIKNNPKELMHAGAMFSSIMGKKDSVNKYVMDKIRPNGNKIEVKSSGG